MKKKKCLNIHVLFHISNSHRYGIRRGMLGFLIATLHEHKHCKRRFFLLFGDGVFIKPKLQ